MPSLPSHYSQLSLFISSCLSLTPVRLHFASLYPPPRCLHFKTTFIWAQSAGLYVEEVHLKELIFDRREMRLKKSDYHFFHSFNI